MWNDASSASVKEECNKTATEIVTDIYNNSKFVNIELLIQEVSNLLYLFAQKYVTEIYTIVTNEEFRKTFKEKKYYLMEHLELDIKNKPKQEVFSQLFFLGRYETRNRWVDNAFQLMEIIVLYKGYRLTYSSSLCNIIIDMIIALIRGLESELNK